MIDNNGERVRLGDVVKLWPDHVGRVVCLLDEAQFSPDYPASEWAHLKTGALIRTDDGNIFHYDKPDEDFRILQSAGQASGHSAGRHS